MLPQVGFGKVVIFFGEYSEGTSTPKLTCYKVEITHVLTLLVAIELILSAFFNDSTIRFTSKNLQNTLKKQRRVAILLLFLGGPGVQKALKKATISAAAQISAEILNVQAGHTAAMGGERYHGHREGVIGHWYPNSPTYKESI